VKTTYPEKFARLKPDLEDTYGSQSDNVWRAALRVWRNAESLCRDPEDELRRMMPALCEAATSEILSAPPREARGVPRELAGGDKLEREHARAISERMALVGNADPRVQAIRASLWGKPEFLTPAAARAFLESPLLRFVPKPLLEEWGIPPVGHTASVIGQETTTKEEIESIEVVWPNDAEESSQTRRTLRNGHPVGSVRDEAILEYPTERGGSTYVRVSPFSVLGDLYREAENLSHQAIFEVWHSLGGYPPRVLCTWFLLTGQVPILPPLSVQWTMPGTVDVITIHALARAASPESIRRAYAKAYEKVARVRRGRPFDARTLRLVQFVERQLGRPVQNLSNEQAERLCRLWNQSHPTLARGKFRWPRDLRNAYLRGVKAFFPAPQSPWDREAILRGEFPWELEALIAARTELARRAGRPFSSEDFARTVLEAIGPPTKDPSNPG
jgi:hypothetical protein